MFSFYGLHILAELHEVGYKLINCLID